MRIPIKVEAAQAAIFLNNINLSDRIKTADTMSKGINSLDGNPTIFPIPDDAPPEIPRVILNSKNGEYNLNIAVNRVDLVYKEIRAREFKSYDAFVKDFHSKVEKLIKLTLNQLQGSIYRLGLIMNYGLFPTDGALTFLKKYLTTSKIQNEKAIQIHILSKDKINEFEINNWIRLISRKPEGNKSELFAVSDVNTLETKKYEINEKNSQLFFKNAYSLSIKTVEKILNI